MKVEYLLPILSAAVFMLSFDAGTPHSDRYNELCIVLGLWTPLALVAALKLVDILRSWVRDRQAGRRSAAGAGIDRAAR